MQPHPVPHGRLRFLQSNCFCPTPPLICSNLPSAWSPQTEHFLASMMKTSCSPKLPPSLHLRPGISVLKAPCSSGVLARTMAQLPFTDASTSGNRKRIKVQGNPLSSAQNTDTLLLTAILYEPCGSHDPPCFPHGRCRNS